MEQKKSDVHGIADQAQLRQRWPASSPKPIVDRKTKAIQHEPEEWPHPFYASLVDFSWAVWVKMSGILGISVQEPVEVFLMCTLFWFRDMWRAKVLMTK